ncbi:hypothetical protein [Acinetobacter stercoris]|uniref:Uncharacterized protein n=1 Tax=Acinetobacter stercoris TaxID=2126983 RepID=A0A2U3MY67_9GAMM|nr:hypothetical protein [Acinetobacter stercoris]SPL70314.1 hypothetical protein KPC_1492 [Acinetobacter stercoris]
MSKTIIPTLTRTHQRLILDNEKLLVTNARLDKGYSYKQGDLLVISDINRYMPAQDESFYHAICGQDVTLEEAEIKDINGIEVPIYLSGIFNIEAVTVCGNPVPKAKYDSARSAGNENKIILLKMGS